MISEATSKAWVIQNNNQFYQKEIDGTVIFIVDAKLAKPLTLSEARQKLKQLRRDFSQRGLALVVYDNDIRQAKRVRPRVKFNLAYLGDVMEKRQRNVRI